jgi:hypothetical protein
VLVFVVVLVLDFDHYWLGERKAACTAKRSISGDRTCQPIKTIENEDEHDLGRRREGEAELRPQIEKEIKVGQYTTELVV